LNVYADTSFFVSLYTLDAHSPAAREMMKVNPRMWFTPLHAAEFMHAIGQQIFLRRISLLDAERVYEILHHDRTERLWLEMAMPDRAFEICASLARRHGPKLGTRTLDSLHVACALELKAERFWTFDERQAKLAKAEGLKSQ
jgi:predicted nucleic acid-binding protein